MNKHFVINVKENPSQIIGFSIGYIALIALIFAITKLLRFGMAPEEYPRLVYPLSIFEVLSIVYYSVIINSKFKANKSKKIRYYLFLVFYLVFSFFLFWLLCFKCREMVDLLFSIENYSEYSRADELYGGDFQELYDYIVYNYYVDRAALVSLILLSIVIIPNLIFAIKCLSSEIKKSSEVLKPDKIEKLKKWYYWLIAISIILIIPFPFSIIVFIPVVAWAILSLFRYLFLLIKR